LRALGRRKRLEEEVMREARVLRAKRPLYTLGTRYPDMFRMRAGHVRLAEYVRARGRTCPVKIDLAVSEKLRNLYKIR
jgi:hypothetical protein